MIRGGERVRLLEAGWKTDLVHDVASAPIEPPEKDRVVVRVEACGVCHRDLIDRDGRFPFQQFPIVPGHEAAGIVEAVGPDVKDFAIGDRVGTLHRDSCGECEMCKCGETSLCVGSAWVFGILADGGYARHLAAPASALYPIPKEVSGVEAATLHCTFGTVYRDLVTLGRLQAGERVLITGANGGCGRAAVQIAARRGGVVVAVVRAERHVDELRRLGAAEVVVDPTNAFSDRVGAIDLALDTVGASTFLPALRSLRVGGRLVVIGNILAEKVGVNLGFLITKGLTVIGGSGATRGEMHDVLAMHATRPFTIAIARTFPLARADEAQRMLRAGGVDGRFVVVPEST
jgi:D-arabinose 1-dehydrogenase-like Zn-dependent alcohol dehydrogenase